jgi:hypothetical protein
MPSFWVVLVARAEARAYLRSKYNSKRDGANSYILVAPLYRAYSPLCLLISGFPGPSAQAGMLSRLWRLRVWAFIYFWGSCVLIDVPLGHAGIWP